MKSSNISIVKGIHAYKDGFFYLSSKLCDIRKLDIGSLSLKTKENIFDYFFRLLRLGVHNIFISGEYTVVVKKAKIVINKKKNKHIIKIDNGSRPLRQGIIIHNDKLYYGDYFGNKNREIVHLYEVDLITFRKKKLINFPRIRHIHFVQVNFENTDELFIGTGDENIESNFYKYNLKKNKLSIIGGGNQTWRAVSLIQKGNLLIWGSDSPYQENYIFYYNIEKKTLSKVLKIDGPAYYSTHDKAGSYYIATTIENKNIHRAKIYKSNDLISWNEIAEFEKDFLHPKLFGYGVIEFINGQEYLNNLYINLRGLKWKEK
jgi:hypothetical protein